MTPRQKRQRLTGPAPGSAASIKPSDTSSADHTAADSISQSSLLATILESLINRYKDATFRLAVEKLVQDERTSLRLYNSEAIDLMSKRVDELEKHDKQQSLTISTLEISLEDKANAVAELQRRLLEAESAASTKRPAGLLGCLYVFSDDKSSPSMLETAWTELQPFAWRLLHDYRHNQLPSVPVADEAFSIQIKRLSSHLMQWASQTDETPHRQLLGRLSRRSDPDDGDYFDSGSLLREWLDDSKQCQSQLGTSPYPNVAVSLMLDVLCRRQRKMQQGFNCAAKNLGMPLTANHEDVPIIVSRIPLTITLDQDANFSNADSAIWNEDLSARHSSLTDACDILGVIRMKHADENGVMGKDACWAVYDIKVEYKAVRIYDWISASWNDCSLRTLFQPLLETVGHVADEILDDWEFTRHTIFDARKSIPRQASGPIAVKLIKSLMSNTALLSRQSAGISADLVQQYRFEQLGWLREEHQDAVELYEAAKRGNLAPMSDN
ncbi:hypothetical protein BCR39DRAFT_550481 [Naematelia encephala]|uniref:Uncharacterized protein n=1 Tax=Naematelia encephala TaxID=71784 RepID=A0A1Y2AK59_9TREE|nr:hypothetical protein BCR39DRAFT_550481 [Naematelia encephala]